MKKISINFFFIICLLLCSNTIIVQEDNQEVKTSILDNAYFRIFYKLERLATRENTPFTVTDTMTLDVGQKWSVYYDHNKMRRDSVANEVDNKNPPKYVALYFDDNELQKRLDAGNKVHGIQDKGNGESMRIFKHRDKGEIVTFDEGPLEGFDTFTYFKLDEEIPPQEWVVTNDTLTVLGYLCQKATATFRGRDYIAWFTTDIPVNDGPWKLYGLPGMILKANDTGDIFKFHAIGLQKLNGETIHFPADKKNIPCKNRKDLNAFRKNNFKTINIGFSDGEGVYTYFNTKNPVVYPEMEIE